MNVLLINGSPRPQGETHAALETVEKILQKRGIRTEWFQLGTEPVRGCIHCERCQETNRCSFTDDPCNALLEQMLAADGICIGTPVYFAGPNGALCALLDRIFYAAANYGQLFAGKPAAALTTCWRAGGTATLDRLQKYFTFSQMPVATSSYWNLKLEGTDKFGEMTLRRLGANLADLVLRCGR